MASISWKTAGALYPARREQVCQDIPDVIRPIPEMLGLFNMFGRADSLKAFDQALRDIGMHPRAVPEAVKLAAVKLVQSEHRSEGPIPDATYARAVDLLGYCMLGSDQFTANTGLEEAARAEARVETAIADGDGLDASLILLALHAGILNVDIAERFDVDTE